MRFCSSWALALLVAGPALALPSPERTLQRIQSRHLSRYSRPLQQQDVEALLSGAFRLADPSAKNDPATTKAYSFNWAGAVLDSPPAATAPYNYVSATLTVPTPAATDPTVLYQAASAWVGIDGATHNTAILQTGIDFYVFDGQSFADPWYEWYPGYALYYEELAVHPGDVIIASVNATSNRRGVTILENLTTGESATQSISAPKSTATLAGWNAEWIVENFESGGEKVEYVGFDNVTFSGCVAEAAGDGFGLGSDSTLYAMVKDDVLVADVHVSSELELVVARVMS